MPKMKTHRGAAKRFRMTANGKIKRSKTGMNHMLTKKNRKRKRRLRASALVHPADAKMIRHLLPYGSR